MRKLCAHSAQDFAQYIWVSVQILCNILRTFAQSAQEFAHNQIDTVKIRGICRRNQLARRSLLFPCIGRKPSKLGKSSKLAWDSRDTINNRIAGSASGKSRKREKEAMHYWVAMKGDRVLYGSTDETLVRLFAARFPGAVVHQGRF